MLFCDFSRSKVQHNISVLETDIIRGGAKIIYVDSTSRLVFVHSMACRLLDHSIHVGSASIFVRVGCLVLLARLLRVVVFIAGIPFLTINIFLNVHR